MSATSARAAAASVDAPTLPARLEPPDDHRSGTTPAPAVPAVPVVAPSARPLVSLVVPAFNEGSLLAGSLTALWDHAVTLTAYRFELIIVNDGSTDDTAAVAESFAAQHPDDVRVVHHRRNQRLGGALRSAIPLTRGDHVVTYDADLSYSVDHLDRLLATLIATGVAVVLASPYAPGGRSVGVPPRLHLRSRTANGWLGLTAQGRLKTLTGLVRAYDGVWLRRVSLKAEDVDVNVELIYKAQLMRAGVLEIPATLDWTRIGTRSTRSHIFSQRERWNVYKALVNGFVFRPFVFPLVPGLLLLLTGGVLFVAAAGVTKVSLLGAVLLVVGSLLCWLSLPLLQSKRYFEELFQQGDLVLALARRDTEAGLSMSGEGEGPTG